MNKFSAESLRQLATCDTRLQMILNDVITFVDFKVLEGHRNKEAQEAAFSRGATTKHWPNGNHNSLPSRAVDIAPLSRQPGDALNWGDVVAFGRLMGYVQACADRRGIKLRFGLDWDGDWRSVGPDPDESFNDSPHVELVDP